jgi:hypothetical protein
MGAAIDLAGGGVDGDELVGASGGGVNAIAGGGEVERVGQRADRDAGELVGVGIENEDVPGGRASAPDFVASRVFAEIADRRAHGNFGDGTERDEIDNRE